MAGQPSCLLNRFGFLPWLLLAVLSFTSQGQGQPQKGQETTFRNRAAQYYLGSEDELLIKVNVWGFVANPGQYLIPRDTDLISLISFAGGPREEAKMKGVKIIRGTAADGQPKIIEVNVKKFLKTGDQHLIPTLLPGDTVIVSGTTVHFIGRTIDFVGKIGTLVWIAWLAVQVSNR